MPELIDRHALLKKVYEHLQEREQMTDGEWCRKCIYEAPKVESEPVRHGRWDEIQCFSEHGIEMASYECTSCGNDIERQRGLVPLYCEFCGAKMDATDTSVGGKVGADNG